MHHVLRCLVLILLSLSFTHKAIGEQSAKVVLKQTQNISVNRDPYPRLQSKKGLQVQMVDDAIALGVKHAAINFNLGQMVSLDAATNDFRWESEGRSFYF